MAPVTAGRQTTGRADPSSDELVQLEDRHQHCEHDQEDHPAHHQDHGRAEQTDDALQDGVQLAFLVHRRACECNRVGARFGLPYA